MAKRAPSKSISWLIASIKQLPQDELVPKGTQGYNVYQTQKEHWLGWLDPTAGTGTYPRRTSEEREARDVYNRIVEPKMLIWLATVAKVDSTLLHTAISAAAVADKMLSKSAAIRKHIPWSVVEAVLGVQWPNNAA